MNFFSLVVPVYHNAASLRDLWTKFDDLARQNANDKFEFLFVDDGSRDESFEVLLEMASRDPRVRVLKLSRNFGSNPAILAGLSHARGEAIVAIAADLQDPPELIHDMLDHWRRGRRVVLAARETRDDPGITSLMADAFYALFRRFAIKNMPKRGFDFFLIDRKVCDFVKDSQECNSYLMGLILWAGFDPLVLPYHRRSREAHYGQSMWNLSRKIKYFIDGFVAFSYTPVRMASILGFVLGSVGLLYAIWVIFAKLFLGLPTEGWASLMVVLLVVSGSQMISIGILGEYLCRNLDETRRRPRFLVDRIVEAENQGRQSKFPSQAA